MTYIFIFTFAHILIPITVFIPGILEASGVCSFHASRTIRLSLGRDTTMEEIDLAIQDIKQAIEKLIGRSV